MDTQISDKNYQINSLEARLQDLQANFLGQLKEVQFKVTRHETSLVKIEADHYGMSNAIKDLQAQLSDANRAAQFRMNETDKRISELNSKFDSILTEQTMVLKNVEGDTIKQLSLIDNKTRTMLEDVRSQLNNLKATSDSEMVRMESRLMLKMDDANRNTDRYDRIDRKIEDLNLAVSKRFNVYEDDFQRNLSKLSSSIDVSG